jgi:hypothetical protein
VEGLSAIQRWGENLRRGDQASEGPTSQAQRRAMWAAASGRGNIGIPRAIGKEFAQADPGGKLPEKKSRGDAGTSEGAKKAAQTRAHGPANQQMAKAHSVATQHGFQYKGTNEKGHEEWSHPSGATLRVAKGGIGRGTGSHVATVQTGPNTSRSMSHPVWPENAVRSAIRKSNIGR